MRLYHKEGKFLLTFKLTEEQAQQILDCLVQKPYVEVVDVINTLQSQASEQMQESETK